MYVYYFLFVFALIWVIAAIICDMKKREVPNWVNFSLIAFALAYKLFYSIFTENYTFFLFGIIGFIAFLIVANLFYYTKLFAGGDTKLLIGIGCILPFGSFSNLLTYSLEFIFLLFFFGAIYSLVYSIFLVIKNKKQFLFELKKQFSTKKMLIFIPSFCAVVMFVILPSTLILAIFIILMSILYLYFKSLDICMIKLIEPENLTEGDWLEKEIRIKGRLIAKSVHGLSLEDIKLIRNAKKRVYIKEGIPFTPAFLLALLFMVFFYPILESSLYVLLAFLS